MNSFVGMKVYSISEANSVAKQTDKCSERSSELHVTLRLFAVIGSLPFSQLETQPGSLAQVAVRCPSKTEVTSSSLVGAF